MKIYSIKLFLFVVFQLFCVSQVNATLNNSVVKPAVVCLDSRAVDQDDMCIWVNKDDRSKSAVIASDKKAGMVFVYDLEGKTIQAVRAIKPGNIDVRYDFPLGGQKVDIVAFNQRKNGYRILVYKIDPRTRQLFRIDNGGIETGKNYGGALYHSTETGKYYFIITSRTGLIEQYELSDDKSGRVMGRKVRSWKVGACEGIVADDEARTLYIAEEKKGVWCVGAEPHDPVPGQFIIKVGENGLASDIEGVTIYKNNDAKGFLIVSSQGNSSFKVYELGKNHKFLGTFMVENASETDGIDAVSANLGGVFCEGMFSCHSDQDRGRCPVFLIPWKPVGENIFIQSR